MINQSSLKAVITGGTSGIGFATAKLLHEAGYTVLVTGKNPETLNAAMKSLPQEVIVFNADSRSLSDIDRLASEVKERFGRLDFLYLNAGTGRMVPIETVDEKFFDDVVGTNLKGQYVTGTNLYVDGGMGSAL